MADGGLQVRGWAVTGRARETTEVRVTVDGRRQAVALTTIARPAVVSRFPGTWASPGYDITVRLRDGRHRYCVRARSVLGAGAGTVLGCREISYGTPVADRSARLVSRRTVLPAVAALGLLVLVAGSFSYRRCRG